MGFARGAVIVRDAPFDKSPMAAILSPDSPTRAWRQGIHRCEAPAAWAGAPVQRHPVRRHRAERIPVATIGRASDRLAPSSGVLASRAVLASRRDAGSPRQSFFCSSLFVLRSTDRSDSHPGGMADLPRVRLCGQATVLVAFRACSISVTHDCFWLPARSLAGYPEEALRISALSPGHGISIDFAWRDARYRALLAWFFIPETNACLTDRSSCRSCVADRVLVAARAR